MNVGTRESGAVWTPSRLSSVRCPEDWAPIIFMLPALTVVCVFLLWPLIQLIGLSFTSWDGYGQIRFDGFSTWASLISDPNFVAAFDHTLLWTALSAVTPVFLGLALAVLFGHSGARVGAVCRAVAIVPLLLPPTVAAATWQIVYNPLFGPLDGTLRAIGLGGLALGWLGGFHIAFWALFVVALWSSVGFSMLLFTAAMRAIDQSYFDLARVEGAGFWSELRFVILPACRRTAALSVVVTVVATSQILDLVRLLTNGGPGTATLMIPLDMYDRSFGGGNVGQGAADACVQVAVGLLLAVVVLVLARTHEGLAGESSYGLPRPRLLAGLVSAPAGLLLLMPLLWDVLAALTTGRSVALEPLTVALGRPTLAPFGAAWGSGIGTGLWESLSIAAVVVLVTLLLSFPAAFGLSMLRRHPVARTLIVATLVLTLLQPGEAYIIPIFYLLLQLGLLNSATGIIVTEVAQVLPFVTLLLWLTMQTLSSDVLGAAEIDAGRGVQLLARVVAPLLAPVTAAASLWIFVSSWSDYSIPTLVLSTSSIETAPMALATFIGTHDTQFNLLAAGTLLLVVPVIIALALAYGPAGRGLRSAGRMILQ